MPILDLMRSRYSLRLFDARPVEREILLQVLEAARIAPSACNNQPWHFLVVQEPAVRQTLAACYPRDWVATAPAILVCCAEPAKAWRRRDGKNHADIDVAIAVDHITLAAAEAGLGTCWVCAFDVARAKALLQLPAGIEPVALVPIGYPGKEAAPADLHARRKAIEEIVHWDRF